jgi:uncharacterized protein (DUF4415 family)
MHESDPDIEMRQEYDFSEAIRGPVVPPAPGKTRITIRVDNDVLDWFRAKVHAQGGGNYQTLINQALRAYIVQEASFNPAKLEKLLRRVIRGELHRLRSGGVMSTPRNSTTSSHFNDWLDAADPEGAQEVYDLYQAVEDETSEGIWEIEQAHDGLILKAGHVENSLTIPFDQKEDFLSLIENTYCRGMAIESWYGVQRNLENPHA